MSALSDFQGRVERISRRYEAAYGIAPGEDWIVLKLQEELGELTQAYLAATGRSRHKSEGETARQDLAREIADVLGFVLVLAERLQIDAGAALEAKWLYYETAS